MTYRNLPFINIVIRRMPVCILFMATLASCKKFLDKNLRQDLAIPSRLSELQAVLDNQTANTGSPGYLELVADNFYFTAAAWGSASVDVRTNYTWDKDAVTAGNSTWDFVYTSIYHSNFVLDLLPGISYPAAEQAAYNNIQGTALFYRSFMFHQLAQLFCKPYSNTAATDPGIVLRLTPNVEAPVTRATVQQTYDQVLGDLKAAVQLLPVTAANNMRPGKAAAYALLARVYLSMRNYTQSGLYADSCLRLNNTLLDYKSLTAFPAFLANPEILFVSYEGYVPPIMYNAASCFVDTLLYRSYNTNDLRKSFFFGVNGTAQNWKGSYTWNYGTYTLFDGIATDEVYLIRAECLARDGKKDEAMADLNQLLRKRWNGSFSDITATDAADALNSILTERRKELVFRGLRWSDLRRYNLEGRNIMLTRKIGNELYTLPPNDLRWVLLIPTQETNRSGIAQNPR